MENPKLVGLLVRVEGGAAPGAAALGAAAAPLEDLGFGGLEPLFEVPATNGGALGAAPTPPARWFRTAAEASGVSPWEAVHRAARTGLGLGAAGSVYVEPDLEQTFLAREPREAEALAAAGGKGKVDDSDPALPTGSHFGWHLDDDRTELRAARQLVGDPGGGNRVRIAHLDTGFDPAHETKPQRLLAALQRNFIAGENGSDAHDPGPDKEKFGVLDNPGHGTATLALLAGATIPELADFLGGAPAAEVVPMRIAKSVVLLGTSALAAALDHVSAGGAGGGRLADVVSLSMGGVASRAWADAVNKAYEAGVCIVAAAGNNFSTGLFGVPTRFIVYPARFHRVIAVCGVMADRRPYYGLPAGKMQGNWGPASKMATALAAFTPNMPWAELGAATIVDLNGAGTSAATPQVAAAAALWLDRHRAELAALSQPWQRVEAVRHALFTAADKSADGGSSDKLGNGIVRARRALDLAPVAGLPKTPADSASFAFLRVLTGFGLAPTPQAEMFALEATQLAQQEVAADEANPFESIVPDPDLPASAIAPDRVRRFLDKMIAHPRASNALREHLKAVHQERFGGAPPPAKPKRGKGAAKPPVEPPGETAPAERHSHPAPIVERGAYLSEPPYRSLRGYAIDPSLAQRLETMPVSQVTFSVHWEKLHPGPVGEYLEVIDFDPANRCFYERVDLDDKKLLAQDGLPPSEGTPQFHQQMVYAVASLTIHNFERALGRKVLWSPRLLPAGKDDKDAKDDSTYVQRLRIYPHALREANAYYSPQKKALLFGYFPASKDDPGEHLPGGMVFTCLSHDVIAHETTHALLDGMHRRFISPSNPDVLAFHEGFADIVALLQHFTLPEILAHEIAKSRGEIRSHQNLLGEMAGEFGRATGMRGALRDAIGKRDEKTGTWIPHVPDPADYEATTEPHLRGAILVAAVFDAFLSIYESRIASLLRLATGGSGLLPGGAIHPDLVERLTAEATRAAGHVLLMCVRALDYCPPVDITFGEYLRALITADYDLVRDDDLGYRVAFVEAFRRRGLYPPNLRTLSTESLRWARPQPAEREAAARLESGLETIRAWTGQNAHVRSRCEHFQLAREMRRNMHGWLLDRFRDGPRGSADAVFLGLDSRTGKDDDYKFEVHSLRIANRVGPDGDLLRQAIVGILQERHAPLDPNDPHGPKITVEGGCTVVANLETLQIDYCIRKNAASAARLDRQREHRVEHGGGHLHATYFGEAAANEPFAVVHRGGV